MTLAEYQAIYGTKGLVELAERAGTKLSYIRKLICVEGSVPSAPMCLRLIDASNGRLTLQGLVHPVGQGSGA